MKDKKLYELTCSMCGGSGYIEGHSSSYQCRTTDGTYMIPCPNHTETKFIYLREVK